MATWTGLPRWISEDDADFGGMLLAHNDRAVAAGLHCRALSETVADILTAFNTEPAAAEFPNAIPRQLEAQLIGADQDGARV